MGTRHPRSSALRIGRTSLRNHYYFLSTSISGRRKIFASSDRAEIAIGCLEWLKEAGRFDVEAAVVMPDHVHFAGALRDASLASVMHSFKSFTANRLAWTGVRAPVWQAGYHDHGLRDDEDYHVRLSYLLNNPVRAGLVSVVTD